MSSPDTQQSLLIREKIQLSPDSVFVFHPRWTSAEKNRLRAVVRLPDGRFTEMECDRADARSPLLRDIMAQYTEDEIELFTVRHSRLTENARALEQRVTEDRKLEEKREAAYQAKAEAFQIAELNLPGNEEILRRVRQAKSRTEVIAWTAVALGRALSDRPGS